MACDIAKRQNSPDALRLVRAFRQGHAEAKTVGMWQLVLSGVVLALGVIAEKWMPGAKPWVALGGILFTVVDAAFLETLAKSKQQAAALIQEQFDSVVLQLRWTKKALPETEQVDALAAAYARKHGDKDESIEDWYPAAVDVLPIEQARLICQRSNMWWDGSLRGGIWKYYLVGIIVLLMGGVAWALARNLRAEEFVLVLASLSPAAAQLLRRLQAHREAGAESERAKQHVEEVRGRISRGELSMQAVDREAGPLQEEIYQRRRSAPQVPERLYQHNKAEYQQQMVKAAERMVTEALKANAAAAASSRPPALMAPAGGATHGATVTPDAIRVDIKHR